MQCNGCRWCWRCRYCTPVIWGPDPELLCSRWGCTAAWLQTGYAWRGSPSLHLQEEETRVRLYNCLFSVMGRNVTSKYSVGFYNKMSLIGCKGKPIFLFIGWNISHNDIGMSCYQKEQQVYVHFSLFESSLIMSLTAMKRSLSCGVTWWRTTVLPTTHGIFCHNEIWEYFSAVSYMIDFILGFDLAVYNTLILQDLQSLFEKLP